MDRLTRRMVGFGLVAVLAAPGCKSTRPEVPPGTSYSNDGRQLPSGAVGFSSDPRPLPNNSAGLTPGVITPNAAGQFGTPPPGEGNRYGAPTDNAYGAPGTSGRDGASAPISPSLADPSTALPATADPTTGSVPATARPDPTQSPIGSSIP